MEGLIELAHDSEGLSALVQGVASATERPFQALRLQALMQLPRVASRDGVVDARVASIELHEIALELPLQEHWQPAISETSPRELAFGPVTHAEAFELMSSFHYLRSPREHSVYYGLRTRSGKVAAFCACSTSDEPVVQELLFAQGHAAVETSMVSRVFAFDQAPRNSLSFMLARVLTAERSRGMAALATYVNPNLGFSGSSYLASGWQLLGQQVGTTYRYLDRRYTTDRVLASKFGPADDDTYRRLLGSRFAVSSMPLRPLLIFGTDAPAR